MEDIFDPLRKKFVRLTPEEQVRQWFIGVLHKTAGVPLTHMMSEVQLHIGGKSLRADIIVYDRKLREVCIVECKEPSVRLDGNVLEQALRYDMAVGVPYICITNGKKTFFFKRTSEEGAPYGYMDRLPAYEEMAAAAGQKGII